MSYKHRLDDYYSDDRFLELVQEFENEHDDLEDLVNAVDNEISQIVMSCAYDCYDLIDKESKLSEATTHINALRYIINKRHKK
jgi:hypothetical protein